MLMMWRLSKGSNRMNVYKGKGESCLPEGLDTVECSGEGYEVLIRYQSWRVAEITYAEQFDHHNICRLESHENTDEVFVLMRGKATLYIGPEGQQVRMVQCRVYNVKCGIWHGISVDPGARVLICENDETGPENTRYMGWSPGSTME